MKQFICSLFALILMLSFASAQPCGTAATPENVQYLEQFQGEMISYDRSWTRGVRDIPVKFHIVQNDNGERGISPRVLDEQIEVLNEIYLEANLRFVRYDEPNIIRNSAWVNFDYSQDENAIASRHEVSNVMNVFCMPSIPGLCGYAYFPGSARSNRIFMNNACMGNGSTFVHEVGHFFGLYHTHGTTNTGTTNEYVSRNRDANNNGIADCEETGDNCCDTPADPNLGRYPDFCSSSCGSDHQCQKTDPAGDCYKPMAENLMSYNPNKKCRNVLSPTQLSRVEIVATRDRSYLKIPENIVSNTCGGKIAGSVKFSMEGGAAMPLELDVNLYRFRNSYKAGDKFTFEAKNNSSQALNLYVINMDYRKKVVKVFPYHASEKPSLSSGQAFDLGGFIELDRNTGKEYACFLFSKKELDIDAIVARLQNTSGSFTQRLYSVLGEELLPLDKASYQQGTEVQFEGCLDEGEILPVMMEMNRS